MKTNTGQTQTQQNSAATQAVQKKKAPSDTLAFEDQRESSREQAELQASIDQSPAMLAQRKQMASVFGSATQRQTPFPFLQKQSSKGKGSPAHTGSGSSTPTVQRELGDEPLVAILKSNGSKAKNAYDLLCTQVEVGKKQVELLNFYTIPPQDLKGEALQTAKDKIDQTSAKFNQAILNLPAKAGSASAKAEGIGAAATVDATHDVLTGFAEESCLALASIRSALSQASGTLVKIKEEAVRVAQEAMECGDIGMMRSLLKVADDSHAEATRGDSVIVKLNSDDKVKASGKEKAANVVGNLDTANNVTTGVGFSVISIVDIAMGAAFVLSAGAALALGLIGGILGTVFGAIGIFLGVKSWIRGKQKKKALKNAKTMLSNDDLKDIADYAIEQKKQKMTRGKVAAFGGGVALTAGVLGLLAISVLTLGVAALVVGLAAALIGLGMVAYRMMHSWKKRKSERKAFADELIAQVRQKGENEAEAKQMIAKVGMNPDNINEDPEAFSKKLSKKVGGLAKSKREATAGDLVGHLVGGKPSEVFDAQLILGALGMDTEKIREQVDTGKTNKAVSKVAGKMASW